MSIEHPDISYALRTGYASFQSRACEDTPEAREMYIEDHTAELLDWLSFEHPEILEEFIENSGYYDWLN